MGEESKAAMCAVCRRPGILVFFPDQAVMLGLPHGLVHSLCLSRELDRKTPSTMRRCVICGHTSAEAPWLGMLDGQPWELRWLGFLGSYAHLLCLDEENRRQTGPRIHRE